MVKKLVSNQRKRVAQVSVDISDFKKFSNNLVMFNVPRERMDIITRKKMITSQEQMVWRTEKFMEDLSKRIGDIEFQKVREKKKSSIAEFARFGKPSKNYFFDLGGTRGFFRKIKKRSKIKTFTEMKNLYELDKIFSQRRDLGIVVPKPVGILETKDGNPYIVMQYRPHSKIKVDKRGKLNNWDVRIVKEIVDSKEMVHKVGKPVRDILPYRVGEAFGLLAANKRTHGDPALRHIFYNKRENQVVLIDLENSKKNAKPNEVAKEALKMANRFGKSRKKNRELFLNAFSKILLESNEDKEFTKKVLDLIKK